MEILRGGGKWENETLLEYTVSHLAKLAPHAGSHGVGSGRHKLLNNQLFLFFWSLLTELSNYPFSLFYGCYSLSLKCFKVLNLTDVMKGRLEFSGV